MQNEDQEHEKDMIYFRRKLYPNNTESHDLKQTTQANGPGDIKVKSPG
jgi:hypothetical protein